MGEHPLVRANEMMAVLEETMGSLLEQRIGKQRTGCEESRIALQQKIWEMAKEKKDGIIALCYLRSIHNEHSG